MPIDALCGRQAVMWDHESQRALCGRHAPRGWSAEQLDYDRTTGRWTGPNGLSITDWAFEAAVAARVAQGVEPRVARLQLRSLRTWSEPGMLPTPGDALDEAERILRGQA